MNQTTETLTIFKGALTARIIGLLACVGSLVFIPLILNPSSEQESVSPAIGLAIVGVVALIGLLSFFLSTATRIVLRRNGPSNITKKRLLGNGHADTFDTSNVQMVTHSTTTSYNSTSEGGTTKTRIGEISLVMKDGSTIELFSDTGKGGNFLVNGFSLSSFRQSPLMKEAETVAGFLGVPLSREGELTAQEAIKQVGSIFQGENPSQPPQTAAPTTPAAQPTEPSPNQNNQPPASPPTY